MIFNVQTKQSQLTKPLRQPVACNLSVMYVRSPGIGALTAKLKQHASNFVKFSV